MNRSVANSSVSQTESGYWTTDRIRVEGDGPDGSFVVELDKPFAIVGTHPMADIQLKGMGIDRRHLYLHVADNRIFCVNLDHERELQRYSGCWIDPEQSVDVGPYRLKFGLVNGQYSLAEPDAKLLTDSSRKRPMPLLRCRSDRADLGRRKLAKRLSIVGRNAACSIQFTTRSISLEHCVLYHQDETIWIIDLLGAGKTLIKDKPVRCARLQNNTKVELGRVNFRVHLPWQENGHSDSWQSDIMSTSDSTSDDSDLLRQQVALEEERTKFEQEALQSAADHELIDKLQSKHSGELEERAADLDRRADDVKQREKKLEELRSRCQDQQTESDDRIEKLDAEHKQTVAQLESQLNDAQRQAEDYRIKLNRNTDDLTKRLAESESRQEQFDTIKEERTKFELDSSQLAANRKQFDNLHSDRVEELEQREANLDRLTDDVNRREQELEKLQRGFRDQHSEADDRIEKLNAEHDQIVGQLEFQLSETQRQAEDYRIKSKQDADDLITPLVEFESRQGLWAEEKKQQEEELAEQRNAQHREQQDLLEQKEQLAAEQLELEAGREKLGLEQKEFERFLKTGLAQRQVLVNLNQLEREKKSGFRLFRWLTRPFRRSN